MSSDNISNDNIKDMVEARVKEESAGDKPAEIKQQKLPLDFIMQCLSHNRIGDATLYAALNRGKFVYVKLWGRRLYWDKHHWVDDINDLQSSKAVASVCDEYRRILVECDEADDKSDLAKAVRKRLYILEDSPGIKKLLECTLFLRDNPMYIEGDELDKQEFLIACTNGVVDLRTGELQDGKPEQYILNACPTKWLGLNEASPVFMQFLNSSFDGDEPTIKYILRLLGYGLLGSRDDHIWAIFHGPRGRNGKDTLMKIIKSIIGQQLAIKIPTAMILQQTFQRSSSQPEPDIMALRGAKFAFASEGEANQRIAMSKLKDITGGSILTARGLLDKLMTSWEQTHLLFFLTNELPRMKADDDAFWSRLHAIHWPIRFVDKPQAPDEKLRDPKMFAKLLEESSGIFARIVEGCMDYLSQGLNPPEKVLAYTSEQRDQFDDIGAFIQDCCEREPLGSADWQTKIPVSEFVATLNWWCKKTLGNAYNFSHKKVTQTLDKKGIPSKKSSVMYYLGIVVKPDLAAEYAQSKGEDTTFKGLLS